jgi:hypothetical protein
MLSIGWVLTADLQNDALLQAYACARQKVENLLRTQFPQFGWDMPFVKEPRFAPQGALDPLTLLELGVHEKLSRRWDYALVIVPNDLVPRDRLFTLAVPSSALEVGVLSSVRLGPPEQVAERLAALALHVLGHLWGLDHAEHGPMRPPADEQDLHLVPFPTHQCEELAQRFAEAANGRLQEQARRWSRVSFYCNTLLVAPRELLDDIRDYAPWKLPLRMGRLTAAAAVSTVFLLLDGGAWAVGINQPASRLVLGALLSVLGATIFVFWGQQLGQLSRSTGWREQAIRTRIVVFCTLLVGLAALWVTIFTISWLAAFFVPPAVVTEWTGSTPTVRVFAYHAAFMASLGVLASALGGNLEEEAEIKADLFFDEET